MMLIIVCLNHTISFLHIASVYDVLTDFISNFDTSLIIARFFSLKACGQMIAYNFTFGSVLKATVVDQNNHSFHRCYKRAARNSARSLMLIIIFVLSRFHAEFPLINANCFRLNLMLCSWSDWELWKVRLVRRLS